MLDAGTPWLTCSRRAYSEAFWVGRTANDDDARYFGTGAFNKKVFGFGAQPSRGFGGGATEIDAVASYTFNKHLSAQGGYSYMWGRGLFNANRYRNVSFGHLQLTLKY